MTLVRSTHTGLLCACQPFLVAIAPKSMSSCNSATHARLSDISGVLAASVKLMYAPQPQPKQIQALSQFTVTKVACGQNHTLALTQEGQAFSWGRTLPQATYHDLPVSLVQHAEESSAQFDSDCPKALCQVHLTKATHFFSYANVSEVLPAVTGKTDWAVSCAM